MTHVRGLSLGSVVLELGVVYGEERSVVSSVLQRVDQAAGRGCS